MRKSPSPGAAPTPILSKTAEHAVRALLVLAANSRPLVTDRVAEASGIPRNYLSKTLSQLAKGGLLRSSRGPNGGFTLAVPAEDISIARVADLFGHATRTSRCLLGDRACTSTAPCEAHRRWTAMTESVRAPLLTTTIADLLGDGDSLAVVVNRHPSPSATRAHRGAIQ